MFLATSTPEVNTVLSAVSTVGFPIVCAFVCMWFCYKLIERGEDERREQREHHEKEMESIRAAIDGLKTVIEQNSTVLASLKERLEDKL